MLCSKFPVILSNAPKLRPLKWGLKFSTTTNEKQYVVTVLNASTRVGRNTSLLLKQCPLLDELRLFDNSNSVIAVAEDLSHIDTRTRVRSFTGVSVLKHAITDADIVIALGGCKTKQGQSPKDLFEQNLDDVRTAALHMIEFNSKGILCLTMPPIESFVPLVSEMSAIKNELGFGRKTNIDLRLLLLKTHIKAYEFVKHILMTDLLH